MSAEPQPIIGTFDRLGDVLGALTRGWRLWAWVLVAIGATALLQVLQAPDIRLPSIGMIPRGLASHDPDAALFILDKVERWPDPERTLWVEYVEGDGWFCAHALIAERETGRLGRRRTIVGFWTDMDTAHPRLIGGIVEEGYPLDVPCIGPLNPP